MPEAEEGGSKWCCTVREAEVWRQRERELKRVVVSGVRLVCESEREV
jgi:hypothetical protein